MRVVLAPDGFGGTLTAREAATALAEGWSAAAPDDELVVLPLSDGGPGLVEVLSPVLAEAELRPVIVEDALARPVEAQLLLTGAAGGGTTGGTAWVESAQACGLHLLAPSERDPRTTTTYGVGQLVSAALDAGAGRIVVGLGGSATNDGGAGLLAALGLQRLAADGSRLPPGGVALAHLDRIEGEPDPRLAGVELVAATDVEAPLLGLYGASAVFGPQKGASANDVQVLDAALARWADALEAHLQVSVRDLPGAGAAGGLGAALLALGARRVAGLGLVAAAVGLDAAVAGADLVVTGEGTFDATSLRGKVVSGVAAAASEHAVPCLVLAGQVTVGRRESAAIGVEEAYAVADLVGLEASLSDPAGTLAQLAARVAGQWSR